MKIKTGSSKKAFGKTWWGNAWVEAMERIDYNTNRLPRGRRYAGNGSVLDIRIENGEVLAKVQGSRPRPYQVRIKLKNFLASQVLEIKKLIARNIAVAMDLNLGRLPESMLELLEEKQIFLLPRNWKDIDGECSCPDWANPCKHLAAVYYIIANEIDKNPFLVFNLKGLSTDELCRAGGLIEEGSAEDIVQRRDCYRPYGTIAIDDHTLLTQAISEGDFLQEPDFSFSSPGVKNLFSLLPDNPLFYPQGDFKKILADVYKEVALYSDNLTIKEHENIFLRHTEIFLIRNVQGLFVFISPPHRFLNLETKRAVYVKVPVVQDGNIILTRKKGALISFEKALEIFLSMPLLMNLEDYSQSVCFFSFCTTLALALLRSASFAPEAIMEEGGSFSIRYTPLIHDEKAEKSLDYARSLMPLIFSVRTVDNSVLAREGFNEIISAIMTGIIHSISFNLPLKDKVCHTFFKGGAYKAAAFEEKQTGKSVSDWLARFSIRKKNISPVIRIELGAEDRFDIHLDVENKKDPLSPFIPLSDIFDGTDPVFSQPARQVRNDVSRQIALAGDYLPQLKVILNNRGKSSCTIDTDEMIGFMTGTEGILSVLGIRIVIPKELKRLAVPKAGIKASIKGKKGKEQHAASYLSLEGLLDFSWEVSIGDATLTKAEFLALVKSAKSIARFRDQYVLLDPEAVKTILDKLRKSPGQLTALETLQSAFTGDYEGMFFKTDDAIRRIMEDITRIEDIGLPALLNARLRPYQERGFRWLYSNTKKGFGSCMADDMGLGKTIQVIALILKLKEEGWLRHPVLIVCPTTIVGNWEKECMRFAPSLNLSIYHGTERNLIVEERDAVITTYGILRRDIGQFDQKDWGLIIVDEAQNIKNNSTEQTKAVKSLKAAGCIAMSGTPVENRLAELWSIFDFINKGYLGKADSFQTRYAVPIEKYRDRKSIDRLRIATGPFVLRRLKKDKSIIDDLPDKLVFDEYCYLTKEQTALYQQVVDSMMNTIETSGGIERKGLVFKLITSLKQICNHPVHYLKKGDPLKGHSGKAEKIIDLAEKIISVSQKALIFTQYREMGELLVHMFGQELGEESLFFHGGLSRLKRDKIIEEFQEGDAKRFMVISLKAGGTGLNLTSAENVIHYDLWWNPAVEDQATDRAYRIGQTKNVMVHRFITLGTFEEKIDEMLKSKKELADLTVTTGEQWITELSDRELRQIFSLHDMD